MGLAPLTWVELKAYCDTRRNELTGWEANVVINMSRAYVSMSREAETITCFPPYQRELTPEEWQERSEMIRKQLDNVGKK